MKKKEIVFVKRETRKKKTFIFNKQLLSCGKESGLNANQQRSQMLSLDENQNLPTVSVAVNILIHISCDVADNLRDNSCHLL